MEGIAAVDGLGFTAPQPDPEVKAKRGRKPGVPQRRQLEELFGTALTLANIGLAGKAQTSPNLAIFVLSEPEIDAETKALTDLILSYPTLARLVGKVGQGGPWLSFFMAQYLIFGPKFARYQAVKATEKADAIPPSEPTQNGAGPSEFAFPSAPVL